MQIAFLNHLQHLKFRSDRLQVTVFDLLIIFSHAEHLGISFADTNSLRHHKTITVFLSKSLYDSVTNYFPNSFPDTDQVSKPFLVLLYFPFSDIILLH